eukprot:1160756-Pelagomonas_calceolata.AAC.7
MGCAVCCRATSARTAAVRASSRKITQVPQHAPAHKARGAPLHSNTRLLLSMGRNCRVMEQSKARSQHIYY